MLTLEFLQFLQDSRTTEYFFVISMTVLVYDHVINFHQEVELIWKKRITCGGATYLLIRYLGLATVIFDANFLLREVTDDKMWVFLILESDQFKLFWNSCQKSLRVENALSSIVLMLADIVLDFRIWILYGKKRTVLLGLLFLTASQWVVTNTLVILDVDKQSEYLHLGPSLKGCYSKSATEADPLLIFAQYYITPIAANAIIMFVLSSYKCGQALWNNGWYRMPVMSLFLRDGFLWFFATFSIGTAQLILSQRARLALTNMMVVPTVAVYCIASSRVLLNLKAVIDEGHDEEDTLVEAIPLQQIH